MTGRRMAAVDAQFYWMSAQIPNDEFLLYAFAGVPTDMDSAIAEILDRARLSPDLTIRAQDAGPLAYPRWVPAAGHPGVVRHRLADHTWTGCLNAVAHLADEQLDIRVAPWRLHVFAPVSDVPGAADVGTVAVLQIAHALADGTRAAALAAWMFGRAEAVPAVVAPQRGWLPGRAVAASLAHRRQVADTRSGLLPPPTMDRPALVTNSRPAGVGTVRTLVRRRDQLPGPTVTVGVLVAVSSALSDHLEEPGESLGAELPIAKAGARLANNHFTNIRVGLYPQLARQARTERIAADIADGRRRAGHPAAVAADRAFAAVPAALLRWGIGRFDADARPVRVTGNTVVSSVHRGAADLCFGSAPVLLTAGFPALSPAMGLTHGVHGIGDTVAITVHAAESAIGDVDGYLRRLDAALG
ncbi:MAG TPA: DUF1298 domain-containing protein [Mycobacterium sp.]